MPASRHQEQRAFFESLQEGFASAVNATREIVRGIQIAGTHVRLRFAGEAMIPAIVDGLAQVGGAIPSGARCEILIWDSESTGVPGPPPPRPRWDFTGRGSIWGFDDEQYRSAYAWGEGSVSVMDREERLAVFWVPSHSRIPLWMRSAPLRSILHWWMESNGRQLVHAAAVGVNGEGVLLPGRGGSGKSSTALACLLDGFDYVSDDYLALELDPEPRAYPLYATAKLDPHSLKRYPALADGCLTTSAPDFDKSVLFLREKFAHQMPSSLAIRRILKPSITGTTETRLGDIARRELIFALASETLVHLPHAGPRTIAFLERAAREIPCSQLLLGSDRARIPEAIRSSISNLPQLPSAEKIDESPFISLVVHLDKPDRDELRALATTIEQHSYPRTELVVTVAQADPGVATDLSSLPGFVRILTFRDPVGTAMGWNRAIREAFADWVFFLEKGDRLAEDTLRDLVRAAEDLDATAWVQGMSQTARTPLRGALVRKSAFLECGLFNTRFEGREQQEWLARAKHFGLRGAAGANVPALKNTGRSE